MRMRMRAGEMYIPSELGYGDNGPCAPPLPAVLMITGGLLLLVIFGAVVSPAPLITSSLALLARPLYFKVHLERKQAGHVV